MISRFAKLFFAIILSLLVITTLSLFHEPTRDYIDPWTGRLFGAEDLEESTRLGSAGSPEILPNHGKGGVIMSKLGNATAKAALGRATWKLLHTVTLRFPEHPTQEERDALKSYLHLTSRLYPCGECAAEFQALLAKYEPQTSSRRAAALWLCHVHNKVNERLGKPEFDCAHLDGEYDCGCGDAPIGGPTARSNLSESDKTDRTTDPITGGDLVRGG